MGEPEDSHEEGLDRGRELGVELVVDDDAARVLAGDDAVALALADVRARFLLMKAGRMLLRPNGALGDPYFSLDGGLAETRHIFLAGNDLPGRFRDGVDAPAAASSATSFARS